MVEDLRSGASARKPFKSSAFVPLGAEMDEDALRGVLEAAAARDEGGGDA
jgi:hypothetical protein